MVIVYYHLRSKIFGILKITIIHLMKKVKLNVGFD